jgi:hypothetical protein
MFLNKIKPFKTLRFMDWLSTNSQTSKLWTDRTLNTTRTYGVNNTSIGNGVPYEDIVRLANTMGKDIWLNIPHLASTDYITQLGTFIYNNLRPDLRTYVEYSNEVWGTQFPGGNYAQTQGLLSGLSTDPTQARFCYLGVMTNKISTIWKNIFISAPQRLTVVVSTQSVNPTTTNRILTCQNTSQYVDAVAIAPYFTGNLTNNNINTLFNTTLPQNIQQINATLKQHLTYTNQYNLKLLCYESGQGLVGANTV